jgi:molybdenum cofactor biosynthesis protein B
VSSTGHGLAGPTSVRCCVITISDTRSGRDDASGDAIVAALEAAGHEVAARRIVRDEPEQVRGLVASLAGTVDAVVSTGGTGITSRDTTYEAISGLLDKRMDGFGELFRMLSFEEIGAPAMLSRACAGTLGRTLVFCLPGSPKAVRLAMDRLIVPALRHAVAMVRT